jgi:hypothetical protein
VKRLGLALRYAAVGYVVAAVAGQFLILQFSANAHDRAVEAAMSGAFVAGPVGAHVALVVGFVRGGRGTS